MAPGSDPEKKSKVDLYNEPVKDGGYDDALLLAAEVATTRANPWTKRMFQLYLVLIVPYLCGCLNGYDGSLMGGINAMSSYQTFFDMCVSHNRFGRI